MWPCKLLGLMGHHVQEAALVGVGLELDWSESWRRRFGVSLDVVCTFVVAWSLGLGPAPPERSK